MYGRASTRTSAFWADDSLGGIGRGRGRGRAIVGNKWGQTPIKLIRAELTRLEPDPMGCDSVGATAPSACVQPRRPSWGATARGRRFRIGRPLSLRRLPGAARSG